jgi:hypothetical protein
MYSGGIFALAFARAEYICATEFICLVFICSCAQQMPAMGMIPGSGASGYVPAKTMGKGQCAFASVIQAIHGQMEEKDMTPYAYIYSAATAANSVLQSKVGLLCMTPFAFLHSHPSVFLS